MQIISDIKVTFSEEQNIKVNKIIEDFVNKMLGKNQSVDYYQKKRNAKKAAEDIFLGKKAEFFALYILHKKYNFPLIKIDLEIRDSWQKGWSKDLPFSEKDNNFPNVHVKACSQTTYDFCDDYSWTFQYCDNDGKFGQDEIFKINNDLVVLVYLPNLLSKTAIIKAIISWELARKHLRDPKKVSLRGLKKCLYYKDLTSKILNL